MAGDWVKMRLDLDEDPAVISVALQLDLPETHVIGCLWKLWKWANAQTLDGNAPGVTEKWVDRYIGVPGFAKALAAVGWLDLTAKGISIPKFDRHNSESAKQRALTYMRVAKSRRQKQLNCNADSVTKTLPETETEKSNTPLTPQGGNVGSVADFDQTPEGMATLWCFHSTRLRHRKKADDPADVAPQMASLLAMGVTPQEIAAEIKRADRDKAEFVWQMKNRLVAQLPSRGEKAKDAARKKTADAYAGLDLHRPPTEPPATFEDLDKGADRA